MLPCRLSEEESTAESLEGDKRKLEDKCETLKGDIENLELHIQKVNRASNHTKLQVLTHDCFIDRLRKRRRCVTV